MHQENEIAGKSMATAEAKLYKAVSRLGQQLERTSYGFDGLSSLSIRGPRDIGDEFLVVARREDEEGTPQVSFHSSEGLVGLLTGLSNRMANGTLKWHTDKYVNGE